VESGDESKIEEKLEKYEKTVQNSQNSDLVQSYEKAEQKLNQSSDKNKIRKQFQRQVKSLLEKEGLKADDLGSTKSKYDELMGDSGADMVKDQGNRDEITKAVLDKLITELENALKAKNKKKIQSAAKKLTAFGKTGGKFKKTVYQSKESKIKSLLAQAKGQKDNQEKPDKFFSPNNPLM